MERGRETNRFVLTNRFSHVPAPHVERPILLRAM